MKNYKAGAEKWTECKINIEKAEEATKNQLVINQDKCRPVRSTLTVAIIY